MINHGVKLGVRIVMLSNELSGKLVVSIEQAVAGPYCGLLLADAGARVIKVERPEGDFARNYDKGLDGKSVIFAWLNRGKESICLNLKMSEDLAFLRGLLASADIFLSNLAPGVLSKFGLTGKVLREKNVGLITCSITGYGEVGSVKRKKAYDILVQAESGLCAVTGDKDSPSKVGISIVDISTGLTAFSGILRGIIRREKTGEGVDISVSMFDVMADWMNMPLLAHRYLGGAPERNSLKHYLIAPYGAYSCKDGSQILISVQSDREFHIFCKTVLKDESISQDRRFLQNSDRIRNREALDEIIAVTFSNSNIENLIELMDRVGIANARLNSVSQLSDHPLLRNSIVDMGTTSISVAALPLGCNNLLKSEVPNLDQNGSSIKKEFGF